MTTLPEQVARLHGEGRLRVWSLVVTIFGDAIAPRGGVIGMSDLSALLETLGVEGGAIRTAMSRLARDGWVLRSKAGRRSFYGLSEEAITSIRSASPRIYAAAPPTWDGNWSVALGQGAESLEEDGFRRISPGTWLRAGSFGGPISADIFLVTGTGAPPTWIRDLLSPPDLADRYAAFTETWSGFAPATLATPAEAIAARTLLIHDWRRVLLRDAPLPRALRPDDWPGVAARDLVASHYRTLMPLSELWLDGCEAAPDRRLPPADETCRCRFGGPGQEEA
jgi:phenylacetic acid degradation operon negative regulatory protein